MSLPTTKPPPLDPGVERLIWWALWGSVTAGLVILYVFFGRSPAKAMPADNVVLNLIGLAPLLGSVAVRWLVLPRVLGRPPALPLFVVGLALAEACGILGIFLGGPHRDALFILAVLGLGQFFPLFLGGAGRKEG